MREKVLLLADDDIDDKDLFREALQSIDSSIVCHVAGDGREVLSTLNNLQQLPQLIFLDINMPIMSGLQCLEQLHVDERYKDIPVIVISTSSHQREMDTAQKFGAVCYFTKPHHFNELTQILKGIVTNLGPGLRSAFQELQASDPKYIHAL